MTTLSYKESDNELKTTINQLSRDISGLERLQGEERSKMIRQIEENFKALNDSIKYIDSNLYIMEQNERSKMMNSLNDAKVQITKLENQFNNAKQRGELFGTSSVVLEGGSKSERQRLLNNREVIEAGNQGLIAFNETANGIQNTGQGTLNDLNDQKEKQLHIDENLNHLGVDMTIGERTIDRMLCRQKRRTAILWIVIVLVVIIFLSVFLYFVFRP